MDVVNINAMLARFNEHWSPSDDLDWHDGLRMDLLAEDLLDSPAS
jgi:hypothetical protein